MYLITFDVTQKVLRHSGMIARVLHPTDMSCMQCNHLNNNMICWQL